MSAPKSYKQLVQGYPSAHKSEYAGQVCDFLEDALEDHEVLAKSSRRIKVEETWSLALSVLKYRIFRIERKSRRKVE